MLSRKWLVYVSGNISTAANIATNVVSNLAEEFLRLCLCFHGVHLTSFSRSQLSQKICHSIVSDQIVSSDTTARVKRSPNGQSKNEIWNLLRDGRNTSSRFHEMLHRKATTSGDSLVTEIIWYTNDKMWAVPALQWGRDNEEPARQSLLEPQTLQRNRNGNQRFTDWSPSHYIAQLPWYFIWWSGHRRIGYGMSRKQVHLFTGCIRRSREVAISHCS